MGVGVGWEVSGLLFFSPYDRDPIQVLLGQSGKNDKEGFNEILTIEVENKDKEAILDTAKREADNARVPPQVYKIKRVVVTKGSRKTTKSEEVFDE